MNDIGKERFENPTESGSRPYAERARFLQGRVAFISTQDSRPGRAETVPVESHPDFERMQARYAVASTGRPGASASSSSNVETARGNLEQPPPPATDRGRRDDRPQ